MSLNMKDIGDYFSPEVLEQGLNYQERHAVRSYSINNGKFIAKVRDTYLYTVIMPTFGTDLSFMSLKTAVCDCPHYYQTDKECRHIVAAAVEFLETYIQVDKEKNEKLSLGLNLIKGYKTSINYDIDEHKKIKLKPKFNIDNYESDIYPKVTFTIGSTKMYVVRNMEYFFSYINKNSSEVITYGKELKTNHEMDVFDDESKQLIKLLSNQITQNNSRYVNNEVYFPDKKSINMNGNTFDLFFKIFLNQEIEIANWYSEKVTFLEGNPEIKMTINKADDGAEIFITPHYDIKFYGNNFNLYALIRDEFLLCSQEFSEKIYPLIDFVNKPIFVLENDLPTLCDMVLSVVNDAVIIEDRDAVCEKFIPDECIPCFYFDIDSNNVKGKLNFKYGDFEINKKTDNKTLEKINRNMQIEEKSNTIFEKYFEHNPKLGGFVLTDEHDEEVFLTEEINRFRNFGDVFLSKSLKGKFVDTKKQPSMGISVADGLITLDIDTGEFPVNELHALYDSFLKKKKYHKLKDGRFLFIEQSGYEKMAEISHMLQLDEKELSKNKITLPAYRSLYLDSVIENSDSVETSKSRDFRRMMKDFKSVADSDYQIPEDLNAVLRPYQVIGYQWLRTLEEYGFGGILADDMGLGKTLQVITFLLSLKSENNLPSLVVCPASLLFNWGDEISKFAPTLDAMIIMGNAKDRKEQIESKEAKRADVWVTSYDLLKRDLELYDDKSFYCMILDEAQHIKNKTTVISKAVKGVDCKQRFVLTGTPIENRLSELWNLFDFIMEGYLFTHNTFVSKLEKPIVQSGEKLARQQLSLLVQPFIMRRLKKDVLKELPDKLEYVRKIQLSEDEHKTYLSAVATVKAKAIESDSKLQILALLTQLRQVCCDPNLCFENYEGESSKLEACLELVSSMILNGHKILLFSQFTTMLDRIRDRLNSMGVSNLTIDGSTTKEKRAKNVKEFQAGGVDVFLISLKAGGTGLNLTSADVVIHYDPWWNQAAQNQATDRAHRIGQKEHVQVYKLIAQGTIEEKIIELQERKASLMDSVMEGTGDDILSTDDILALLD